MSKTERQMESNMTTGTPSVNGQHARLDIPVSSSLFAGRIGGNQDFVVSSQDDDASEVLKKLPDAAPLYALSEVYNLRGFLVKDYWQMAALEGWATCLLTAFLGGLGSGLTTYGISPFAATLYAALANSLGIGLFILSGAPVSGGHFNPLITMATFFAGLSTLPRSVLYIAAQCIGSIVGAYWLRLGLGDAYFFPVDVIPGCTVDAAQVSAGQYFVLEYIFVQSLLFLAFGIGLDPRQQKIISPAVAPLVVGLILGLSTLVSGMAKPGYTGISANPARCLGLMTAKNEMQYHYIHWLADLAACITNGLMYYFIPPYVTRRGG